jgi:hypothetical protein
MFLLASSQLDQGKLDSLSRYIDSSAKITRLSIDSMNQVLDSLMHSGEARRPLRESTPASLPEKQFFDKGKVVYWLAGGLLVVALMVSYRRYWKD